MRADQRPALGLGEAGRHGEVVDSPREALGIDRKGGLQLGRESRHETSMLSSGIDEERFDEGTMGYVHLAPPPALVSGCAGLGLGEEVVEVELAEGRRESATLGPRPLIDRPVPCQLEIIAVRIGEIDRFVGAVVGKLA